MTAGADLFKPPEWYDAPFASLDFEATGTDPYTARPVSFSYIVVDARGEIRISLSGLVDCGVEIPAEATAVHGITTDQIRKMGITPRAAVLQIGEALRRSCELSIPLVIMNARYDWPLLLAEAERNGVEIYTPDLLDPGLLDKGMDRYRKGKRKLTDLCQHYGVKLENAHTAEADALAAALLTRAIVQKFPRLRLGKPAALAPWQANVFEEYRRFLCSDGQKTIAPGWPIPERAP